MYVRRTWLPLEGKEYGAPQVTYALPALIDHWGYTGIFPAQV